MNTTSSRLALGVTALAFLALAFAGTVPVAHQPVREASPDLLREGAQPLRYDALGDEALRGRTPELHDGSNRQTPDEPGIDSFQPDRAQAYRTTLLRGLRSSQKGGFFSDDRFPTLLDAVNQYDQHFGLGLTPAEKTDLVQYLRSS